MIELSNQAQPGIDNVGLRVSKLNNEHVGDEMGPSLEIVQGGRDEDIPRGGEVMELGSHVHGDQL